jgi:hypothetical protein
MKRGFFYITILFLVAILYVSCTESSVENKIDGTWRMINMGNLTPDEYVEWNLVGGYIYMLHTQTGSTSIDTISYGNYNIKIKRLSRFLCLTESSKESWNGDYKITKLNSKNLVIVKDQDMLEMYEFTKK